MPLKAEQTFGKEEKPIESIKKLLDEISEIIKDIKIDVNSIKEKIEEKEEENKISKGWWIY